MIQAGMPNPLCYLPSCCSASPKILPSSTKQKVVHHHIHPSALRRGKGDREGMGLHFFHQLLKTLLPFVFIDQKLVISPPWLQEKLGLAGGTKSRQDLHSGGKYQHYSLPQFVKTQSIWIHRQKCCWQPVAICHLPLLTLKTVHSCKEWWIMTPRKIFGGFILSCLFLMTCTEFCFVLFTNEFEYLYIHWWLLGFPCL